MSSLSQTRHEMAAAMPDDTARLEKVFQDVRLKFKVRRLVGEPYIGKRMKLSHLAALLRRITLPANPKLLECGSGDGVFTEFLSRRWPDSDVTGIELDPVESRACERWARESGRSRLHFRTGNILELSEEPTYDLVICLDVLEHIQDDHRAVERMVAALKPGGWLVVHTPSLWYQRFGGSMHTCAPEDAWKINPGHVRNGYTREQMTELLASGGLEDVQVHARHGRWSDLSHRVYRWFERPAPLRICSLPLVDTLTLMDKVFRSRHGNTVFGMGRKPIAASSK